MRKEYLILAVVIVALGLYIGFKKTDGTHYDLPKLEILDKAKLTKIEISRPSTPDSKTGPKVVLKRQSDQEWTVGPKDYPADTAKVATILDAVADLTLTALVSQAQSYVRYELDDSHKLSVIVYAGDQIQRQFDLGKAAPTYQHSFVKLIDDPAVYHAKGDFRYSLDQEVENLRDQQVLQLDTQKVTQVSLKKGDIGMTFEQVAAAAPEKEAAEGKPTTPSKPVSSWQNVDTREVVELAKIQALLNEIKDLRCSEYLRSEAEDVKAYGQQLFSVEVKDAKHHRLTVAFKEKIDPSDHVAESLDNAYPFKLSEFKLKEMLKAADGLLGIETPAETEAPPEL